MKNYEIYLPGCIHTPTAVPSFVVKGTSIVDPSHDAGRAVMVSSDHFIIYSGIDSVALVSKQATIVVKEIEK